MNQQGEKLGTVIGGYVPGVMETVGVRSDSRQVGGLRGASGRWKVSMGHLEMFFSDATVEHVQTRKAWVGNCNGDTDSIISSTDV